MKDIADYVADVDIVDIVSKHVRLTKNGQEYEGICPFHKDTKPSLKVNRNKKVATCFACDFVGNAYTFLKKLGLTHKEAIEELSTDVVYQSTNEVKEKVVEEEYKPVIPIPIPMIPLSHYKLGLASNIYTYHDKDGYDAMYVYRYDRPQGKEIRYVTHDGFDWRWKRIPRDIPLYNLHEIKNHDYIVIVEGEKTADAGNRYIGNRNILFVTWAGGVKAIRKTDWSSLKGKTVLYLADNDKPGEECMEEIQKMLHESILLNKQYIIHTPCSYPNKWDIADYEWSENELFKFIKNNLTKIV